METALAVSQAKYWHLRQMGLFESVANRELQQLVEVAELRLVKAGTELYRAGDLAHQLYVIRSGKVKLWRPLPDDKRMVLDFHGTGAVVGEAAALGEQLHSDSAEVTDDAFLCAIDGEDFHACLARHPALALEIGAVLARRRRRAEEFAAALLSQDVRTRLAHALVRLAAEHGVRDEAGIRIDLGLTQTDLGQLVGSTRETTSMAFNGFRREGLVEARDRVVWVYDVEALASA